MNIYSVLDSDDEEPKVVAKVTKEDKPKGPAPKKSMDFEKPIERDTKAAKGKDNHTRHGAKEHRADGTKVESGNPKKRVFDRKSGTGRGKEVSKDGAGGANWGNDKLEALKAEKHIAGDAEIVEEPVEEVEAAPAEPAVPEPTVFTFDEYNKRRAAEQASRTQSEAFSEVKLREVTADFSGMKTKESNGESEYIHLGASKAAKAKKEQRSTAKNVIVDVSFKAPPPQREERSGSGRGGDRENRGGRGRGGDRAGGDRPRSSGRGKNEGRANGGNRGPRAPRVDFSDANAFPSL